MANFLGRLLGGVAGAGGGFLQGGPVGAVLSGLGGLAGGQQHMSAAQRHALQMQQAIANQLYGYGTSNPMTNQQDLNALAQSLGLFGAQQRSQLGGLAAGGNILTPTGGGMDQLANLYQAGQANRMAISEQHLADAVAARRQALLNAANVNQGAFKMASEPGAVAAPALGQTLAQMSQAWAKAQAQKEATDAAKKAAAVAKGREIAGSEAVANDVWQSGLPSPTGQPGGGALTPMPLPETATSQTEGYGGLPDTFMYQGAPVVGGGGLPFGVSGPTIPGEGGAFPREEPSYGNQERIPIGGGGDAPELPPHDVMKHAMEILHLIIKNHMASQKPKKKKAKSKGAGDAPALSLPGYGAQAGPPMLQNVPGLNRQQGAQAPGNEPGGAQTLANQARQPASALLDRLRLGTGGLTFPYAFLAFLPFVGLAAKMFV